MTSGRSRATVPAASPLDPRGSCVRSWRWPAVAAARTRCMPCAAPPRTRSSLTAQSTLTSDGRAAVRRDPRHDPRPSAVLVSEGTRVRGPPGSRSRPTGGRDRVPRVPATAALEQARREQRAPAGPSLDLRDVHRRALGGLDDPVARPRVGEHEPAAPARGDRDGSGRSIVLGSRESSITCRSPSTPCRSIWRGRSRHRPGPEPFAPRCSRSSPRFARARRAGGLAGADRGPGRRSRARRAAAGIAAGLEAGHGSDRAAEVRQHDPAEPAACVRDGGHRIARPPHGAATARWVLTGE